MADLQTGITRTAGQTFMGVGKGANVIHETGLVILDSDGGAGPLDRCLAGTFSGLAGLSTPRVAGTLAHGGSAPVSEKRRGTQSCPPLASRLPRWEPIR